MARDANTPLILWVCAAVCAHYMFAEGGFEVAQIHEDHNFMEMLGAHVRDRVRASEQTFEVGSIDVAAPPPLDEAPPPPRPPPPKPTAQAKPEVTPPVPEKAKPPEPKKPEIKVVIKDKDTGKPLPAPPPQIDKRIAVKQHAKPDQEDNPNAHFVADQANHVEQETVATQTSHDQDDPNPTPGGNHAGPKGSVGDSEKTKIAESEEHAGEKNRAPGEKGTEFFVQHEPPPTLPMGPVAVQAPPSLVPPRSGGDGRAPGQQTPMMRSELAPGGAQPPAPEVTQAPGGSWSFNPVRPGAGSGQSADPGPGQASKVPNPTHPGSTAWLGLGGQAGPGQVNINLNHMGVVATVGQDQLRKEREADGERRRSEHRGSWTASNFERWRSAIENYVSSVKPGNQTALNTAAVPFATYLNTMHNHIHPIFADNFLGSLDALPKNHPLNDQKLITRLEIVVTKDGRLVKMGIVRTSGVTSFDIAALDSVQRASPFGPAPGAIISPDGNVYLHWEFHRDEVYACSTMNARPFLINVPEKAPNPTAPPAAPKSPSQERGAPPPVNLNDVREGALPARATHHAS